jgi:hypothetical protein
MSSQKRTIMGALDYSIESLNNLKTNMRDLGNPNHELNWAIGGIMATLVSKLLMTAFEVVHESIETKNDNAVADLKRIQAEFNAFLDGMINHE